MSHLLQVDDRHMGAEGHQEYRGRLVRRKEAITLQNTQMLGRVTVPIFTDMKNTSFLGQLLTKSLLRKKNKQLLFARPT